ncbi:uncharacterized protein TNCV_2206361 [Trichonephila clavipes]|uniref:Uncharacterized protein n=1 Tax=Trichonephila clavipes TaxID=2585209 RepID=A0A8X6S5U4_TRICX|nr:uncharacterized protein TNCV_2206361 [Trichonephila clavipes]
MNLTVFTPSTLSKVMQGCGSPVVKVSNHGRHVMSSIPVPLKTRRVGQRCTLNLSRAETSSRWCGVVVRRGVPAQVSSTSLDHGSKLRGPSPKAHVAEQCDVNINSLNSLSQRSCIFLTPCLRLRLCSFHSTQF